MYQNKAHKANGLSFKQRLALVVYASVKADHERHYSASQIEAIRQKAWATYKARVAA